MPPIVRVQRTSRNRTMSEIVTARDIASRLLSGDPAN
jgi:hypothetical protein